MLFRICIFSLPELKVCINNDCLNTESGQNCVMLYRVQTIVLSRLYTEKCSSE